MKNFSYKIVPPRFEHKFRGSGLLVMALVGAAVVGVTSLSLAKANSVAINSMGSNKIALQAQQYAAAKGELIRATKYSDLAAQTKTNIGNTGFQDEVVVGTEADVDSTTKKKEVTVRVYKIGETLPRSSIIVTRYNKSLDSSIPSGSIIPWYGILGNIPSGFALCDGSNGTPDLRDRFIVGAGNSYNLSAIGGANTVTLTVAQMPSHNHIMSRNADLSDVNPTSALGYHDTISNYDGDGWLYSTSYSGGSQAHENRPPFYALYYIMKF